MDNIQIFSNEEFGSIRTVTIDGEPWFVGKDIAIILGYTKPTDTVRKRVDEEDRAISKMETPSGTQRTTIINESGLYALIFGSKLESAQRFKRWVTSEVLPTIRKTGGYINNVELMVNTYFAGISNEQKIIVKGLLTNIEEQQKENKLLKDENSRKQEIINGFTEDIPVYQKTDIINRICRRASWGYASRYKELYKCFKECFHIDLEKRQKNYNNKQERKKDCLTTIKYAEKFGYIDNLYSCCVKMYETEVRQILKELEIIYN